jgi:hypothetical protein
MSRLRNEKVPLLILQYDALWKIDVDLGVTSLAADIDDASPRPRNGSSFVKTCERDTVTLLLRRGGTMRG